MIYGSDIYIYIIFTKQQQLVDFECHLHLLHLVHLTPSERRSERRSEGRPRTARSLIVWRVGNWCHIRQSCAESNGRHGGHGDGVKGPRFYLVQP